MSCPDILLMLSCPDDIPMIHDIPTSVGFPKQREQYIFRRAQMMFFQVTNLSVYFIQLGACNIYHQYIITIIIIFLSYCYFIINHVNVIV